MNKRTLSIKSVNEILARLEGEKKLLYDAALIEKLYTDYQAEQKVNDEADMARLKEEFEENDVLILGPGTSVTEQSDSVRQYVIDNNPLIISINFIPEDIKPDYCFVTNAKRFVQLSSALAKNADTFKVIATSNVTKSTFAIDYTLKYSDLLDFNAQIIDNSFLMLLNL